MPGPYTDDDACAYARDCLIPDELLDRADLDVESVAAWLRVPADELRLARRERNLRRMDASATPPAGALHVALVSADGTERALRLA
jgi:hypothetical protein